MIYVSCPAKQDYIIKCLESTKDDGIEFKYVDKKGIKMSFDVNIDDLDKAVDIAKKAIKSTEFGSVLFFQVTK